MKIVQEKELAKEILDSLSIICPHAILAGGAPRDWYMGNTCNDLDFYFNLDPDATAKSHHKQLERILPAGMLPIKTKTVNSNPMYKHMKALRRIYYYTYKGKEVQFIQLNTLRDVFKAVDNMSCSICKIWWKGELVQPTGNFLLSYKTRIMYLNEGYCWSDYHPKKMKLRFESQGFHCGTKDSAKRKAISKFMEG